MTNPILPSPEAAKASTNRGASASDSRLAGFESSRKGISSGTGGDNEAKVASNPPGSVSGPSSVSRPSSHALPRSIVLKNIDWEGALMSGVASRGFSIGPGGVIMKEPETGMSVNVAADEGTDSGHLVDAARLPAAAARNGNVAVGKHPMQSQNTAAIRLSQPARSSSEGKNKKSTGSSHGQRRGGGGESSSKKSPRASPSNQKGVRCQL